MQILSDYDYTLTKEIFPDGREGDSSFRCIQESSITTKEVRDICRKLYDTYAPIEVDPNMSKSEKYQHMFAWWDENLRVYAEMALKKEDFAKIILESRLVFRDGIRELVSTTNNLHVPLMIVSGGITEIIEASLNYIMPDNEIETEAVKA